MSSTFPCTGAAALLLLAACSQPVPGVLTLAPAGMRISGTCTPHRDGTLTMAPGATAEAEVYVDAGAVRVTVTAGVSGSDHPLALELFFAGTSLGTVRVESTQRTAFPFHAQTRRNGPVALRLVVHADAPVEGTAATTLDVEKIVITQP